MQPTIPVLMSDISRLSGPVDIIKYILKWYSSVPKNINDTFSQHEISFRWDDAESGHNREILREQVRINLTSVLKRYFPDADAISVTVTTEEIDPVRYSILIDIGVLLEGVPYSVSNDFSIDNNGHLEFNVRGD